MTFSVNGLGGSTSSGFLNNQNNTLELIVNNTNNGPNGSLTTVGSTSVGITGSVTLASIGTTPEPTTFSYLLFAAVPLAFGLARRRRNR
jgi:hypothetical protein